MSSALSRSDRWSLALVGVGALAAVIPLPQEAVERLYAVRMFPVLQRALTSLSNLAPFALFDVALVAACAGVVVLVVRTVRGSRVSWRGRLMRLALRLAAATAVAYLGFLLTWGLNYRRVPLGEKLVVDPGRIRPDAALDLARQSVSRVNELYDAAHASIWTRTDIVDSALAAAFSRAQRDLAAPAVFVPGRPKRSILDGYFRRAGVAGMTDPYFLETLVTGDLLPIERPMVVAHEWSHLAGIADEGDANFAGWLACLHGTAFHQYSGWLFLYGEVAGGLPLDDLRQIAAGLADGPRRDLQAIRDRLLRNINPTVSAAGWRVYDGYLKANQVEEGAASYGHVVRLVLGATFTQDWTPQLREK